MTYVNSVSTMKDKSNIPTIQRAMRSRGPCFWSGLSWYWHLLPFWMFLLSREILWVIDSSLLIECSSLVARSCLFTNGRATAKEIRMYGDGFKTIWNYECHIYIYLSKLLILCMFMNKFFHSMFQFDCMETFFSCIKKWNSMEAMIRTVNDGEIYNRSSASILLAQYESLYSYILL